MEGNSNLRHNYAYLGLIFYITYAPKGSDTLCDSWYRAGGGQREEGGRRLAAC